MVSFSSTLNDSQEILPTAAEMGKISFSCAQEAGFKLTGKVSFQGKFFTNAPDQTFAVSRARANVAQIDGGR